ncbi:MAG: citramalate synthase [Bacillota bacterium]|nr:citramalate synthase [Bacillota bacterium]
MALRIDNGEVIKVIDRSLPEIFYNSRMSDIHQILKYCYILPLVGVDLIEIDSGVIKKIGKLPVGVNFIYRLKSEHDIDICIKHNINYCVVNWVKLMNPFFYNCLEKDEFNITAEFEANSVHDLKKLYRLLEIKKMKKIDNIRIVGLSRMLSDSWADVITNIKENHGVNVDICPRNNFYLATSISVEAAMKSVGTVTAAFGGIGRNGGFTPLEEFLMAIKVLMNIKNKLKLDLLPKLSELYTNMTRNSISDKKPIIGKEIFKYESGIHASGIEKNPATYEPYDPLEVGLERKLVIGKHSGSSAVLSKLNEMGNICDKNDIQNILIKVREKSIEAKRDLNDCEIQEIFYMLKS